MTNTWDLCALWVGLALAATLLAIWFKISTALSEIVVGYGGPTGHWRVPNRALRFCAWRPGGNRRHRTDISCRRGTRSDDLQNQVARGLCHRSAWVLWPIPWMHSDRALHLALGDHAELAVRRCAFHDLGCRGLCSDAGAWLQRHGIWQSNSGADATTSPELEDDLLRLLNWDMETNTKTAEIRS